MFICIAITIVMCTTTTTTNNNNNDITSILVVVLLYRVTEDVRQAMISPARLVAVLAADLAAAMYCIVLCCTALHCTVLCCVVLYCAEFAAILAAAFLPMPLPAPEPVLGQVISRVDSIQLTPPADSTRRP